MSGSRSFPFVQVEFGFALGPADGRYVVRSQPDAAPRRVIVLGTLAAPPPRRRRRRLRPVEAAAPAPAPISRATVIGAAPMQSGDDAARWLGALRADAHALDAEVGDALGELNGLLRTYRAAAADPLIRDVALGQALALRVGHGAGERVADGRFDAAYEVDSRARPPRRRELLAPQERMSAVLAGRATVPPSEELVLRARGDLVAIRPREAALQARVALEALLAELADGSEPAVEALGEAREPVSRAANAALEGEPSPELQAEVTAAVELMAGTVRRRALRSS